MASRSCPVCGSLTHEVQFDSERKVRRYLCGRCGDYRLPVETEAALPDIAKTPKERAVLSYAIRRMARTTEPPLVLPDMVGTIVSTVKLPEPPEQIDNLVIWLGENTESGQYEYVNETHQAVVGVTSLDGIHWALRSLEETGLVMKRDMDREEQVRDANGNLTTRRVGFTGYALSAKGWERYRELKRTAKGGRKAFMAMQYGDTELDKVFRDCFQPAVAATGFELRLLYEGQTAGNIDDRMRTELQTSRFVVADLTHDNRGAYWEAGFGEGAGKPVIYTCRKGQIPTVHFDTNHHLIVEWDPADLPKTAAKLKDTIRATLPAEAKLTDD